MASVVVRKDGRVEIRESLSTPRGPRSRTLAVFHELTERDLEKAERRASRPFSRKRVLERARRLGVPCYGESASRAARALLAELQQGKPLPPILVGALQRATGSLPKLPLPTALRPLLEWLHADEEERGEALRELLHQSTVPRLTSGGRGSKTMPLDDSVALLGDSLRRARIPHAFAGHLALSYYATPRAWPVVDLQIFSRASRSGPLLGCLERLGAEFDRDTLRCEIGEHGQAWLRWERGEFCLTFSTDELHRACERRVRDVPFGEDRIFILSAEDLLIRRVISLSEPDPDQIDADIDQLLFSRLGELDVQYVGGWLDRLLETGDPRRRWFEIAAHRIMG